MLEFIISKIRLFDFLLTSHFYSYITPYYPTDNIPYLSQRIPLFIKIGFYSFFLLIPIGIAKLKHEESAMVNFFLAGVLLTIGLSIITTFFGFFQLLYSYP
jgi:hypothetical protein